jgi:hypothetical protein
LTILKRELALLSGLMEENTSETGPRANNTAKASTLARRESRDKECGRTAKELSGSRTEIFKIIKNFLLLSTPLRYFPLSDPFEGRLLAS